MCYDVYFDDYVFFVDGLLELLQCCWCGADFEFLVQVLEALLNRFEDRGAHGFFFTADDHEKLFYRFKSFMDEVLFVGNVVVVVVLYKVGSLLGELCYL